MFQFQKLLISCQNNHASPTEKEEVELLLTLCGLVRKQPDLAYYFLPRNSSDDVFYPSAPVCSMKKPKKNKLFDYDTLPVPPKKVYSLVSQPSAELPKTSSQKESIEEDSTSSTYDDDMLDKNGENGLHDNDSFILMDLLLSYLMSAVSIFCYFLLFGA